MARQGIQAQGDVLVNELADGTDINELWTDAIAALGLYNGERTTIASLLSFKTTNASDVVPQSIGTSSLSVRQSMAYPSRQALPLMRFCWDTHLTTMTSVRPLAGSSCAAPTVALSMQSSTA